MTTEQLLAIEWFQAKDINAHIDNENVYIQINSKGQTNILIAPAEVSYRADLQKAENNKITREKMVEEMIDRDIRDIKINFESGHNEFLYAVLTGKGWTQYKNLTDEEVEVEYTDMKANQ